MELHDAALLGAGLIGIGVAAVHAVLVDRLMIRPRQPRSLASPALSAIVGRLEAPLLHFTTFNWMLGGLVLAAAALRAEPAFKDAAGLLVASSYLYGAAINLYAVRRLHPGWVLYGIAVGLIAFARLAGG